MASSGLNQNFSKGMVNSLGVISMPQMAVSSHPNYPVQGNPLVVDETSTAAADNTMH